jgi:hypothetical protein
MMTRISHWIYLMPCLVILCLTDPVVTEAQPAPAAKSIEAGKVHPRMKTYMKRQWGVEVLWIKETAGGYMLEYRYKVLDAEKAKPLFERQTKPVLIHEESGLRLAVPVPSKTGALRNSNLPQAGKTYWMFFSNPGGLVKAGDQVSIQIGDYLQQHLIVAPDI